MSPQSLEPAGFGQLSGESPLWSERAFEPSVGQFSAHRMRCKAAYAHLPLGGATRDAVTLSAARSRWKKK